MCSPHGSSLFSWRPNLAVHDPPPALPRPLLSPPNADKLDEATLALLTNDEVRAVNQSSDGNRQLFENGNLIAWIADVPESKDRHLAILNTGDVAVTDLWIRRPQDDARGTFAPSPPHTAQRYTASAPVSFTLLS